MVSDVPSVPDPPPPDELDVTVTLTGAEVRLTLLESVTVTDTLQVPPEVGTQESCDESDEEQPVGSPDQLYEYGAFPPETVAVNTTV